MPDPLQYDVFLSHSSKDKGVVRQLAERGRPGRVGGWVDEWEIRAGDSMPARIEEGVARERGLVC